MHGKGRAVQYKERAAEVLLIVLIGRIAFSLLLFIIM